MSILRLTLSACIGALVTVGSMGQVAIQDTRAVNLLPADYYKRGKPSVYFEFKSAPTISAPTAAAFCNLETRVSWYDATGGPIYQYAHCGFMEVYQRVSQGTTQWSAWGKIGGSGDVPVQDTRSVNSSPAGYYARGKPSIYFEFKSALTISVPTTATFCNLETRVNYMDPTGGPIYQYAHCGQKEVYSRISTGTTQWTTWLRM